MQFFVAQVGIQRNGDFRVFAQYLSPLLQPPGE
jgi:hypothetical protein